MEDYEAQEVEFWAKLEEEGISRSSMLRRSAAAAVGLTMLGSAGSALGATRGRFASPPLKGTAGGMADLIKNAKKEGKLNTIALPRDWANYGELMDTFSKKYGISITNETPMAAPLRRTRRSARSRATPALPTSSMSVSRSRSRAPTRACIRSTSTRTTRRFRVR